MKFLIFFLLISNTYALETINLDGAYIHALIPAIRPLPMKDGKYDELGDLIEAARLNAHELTHVVQQKGALINQIIESDSPVASMAFWNKLLMELNREAISYNASDLSAYITIKNLEKKSPKLAQIFKKYGEGQDDLEKLKEKIQKLERGLDCHDELTNAKAELVQKMAQMNMQFLALQEATQMESRLFQTLSNASKARHDIAMNAIRNMK